jgi:hypothetical protein
LRALAYQLQVATKTSPPQKPNPLFNFVFFEFDVLAHDWIVLLENHLLGGVPGILLGDIEEACTSGGQELDLLNDGLCHCLTCSMR